MAGSINSLTNRPVRQQTQQSWSQGGPTVLYRCAELAVFSLAVVVTIASTHFAYPRRDDQAELAWVAWLNTKITHPSTITQLDVQ